jgi:FkbM family methyltransferase
MEGMGAASRQSGAGANVTGAVVSTRAQMSLKPVAEFARRLLARRGYLLLKRDFARYGMLPFLDAGRIGQSWNGTIGTVFDVGANQGQFASEALRELPFALIYSFEPHPATFRRLTQAISDARFSPHQLAFADCIGAATLYVYGESGDGSLINSLVANAQFPSRFGYEATGITVPCTTIDSFCTENAIEAIDFLKVDAEGGELLVLHGARRMMEEDRVRFVYVEFNTLRPDPDSSGGALLPIADYLSLFGFQYAVTYTDFALHRNEIAVCANALFVAPPRTKA